MPKPSRFARSHQAIGIEAAETCRDIGTGRAAMYGPRALKPLRFKIVFELFQTSADYQTQQSKTLDDQVLIQPLRLPNVRPVRSSTKPAGRCCICSTSGMLEVL